MRGFRRFNRLIGTGGFLACCAFLSGARVAIAATTLGLSTTTINGASGQQIQVTINGTDQVIGSDLYIQIGDGGSGNGGTTTAPTITTISMSGAGMLFSGDASFESFTALSPLIASDSINSPSALSDATSVLATITLNASAFSSGGTFTMQFANVAANEGGPDTTDMIDNHGSNTSIALSGIGFTLPVTITVVPEPTSALALGALGLLLPRCRRRSRNA